MQRILATYFVLFLCACGQEPQSDKRSVLDHVDPFIGTGAQGHTHPGATLPFGMVQVGTTNYHKGWAWCSGYHQQDTVMQGFAHTHLSGTGLTGLGDIRIIPTSGELKLTPGTDENPDNGYSSRWTHATEKASPGYYKVRLDDYNVDAEITASKRVGFHKYTFNEAGTHNVILDPVHAIQEKIIESEVEVVSSKAIRGYKRSVGQASGDRYVYFYVEFSKPFAKAGVGINGELVEGKKAKDTIVAGYAMFEGTKGEQIEAKVALSFVGYEGAKKNFEAEAKDVSFEDQLKKSRSIWEKHLGKVEVEGGHRKDLRTFYTALYHSILVPNLISDVDGNYVVEGKKYHDDGNQYSTYSTWDTFRAQNPLLTILEPAYTTEIVNSLISRQTVAGVGLPIWELSGHDNGCMPSYTPVSVIVDAAMKDLPGINKEDAYRAIQETSMMDWKISAFVNGEVLVPWIKKLNYVPAYIWESCAQTVEYAYQDWCIYQLGKELGKADTTYYKKRSQSYLNLFDKEQGYIVPKDSLGNFLKLDTTDWESLRPHYITGNIWGYTTFVPHEIESVIALKGGKEKFAQWLDEIVNDTTEMKGEAHVDVSGFIGRYGHGDEPSHHIPYLYNYAGQPYKTQARVRRVMREFYSDQPDGLINNEDCGQMSSWYAMGAMGFYSFCPGKNEYTLTSPLFDKVTINQDNGNAFIIKANKKNGDDMYIQSLKANGKAYNSHLITHEMITKGLQMEYELGAEPTQWGIQ